MEFEKQYVEEMLSQRKKSTILFYILRLIDSQIEREDKSSEGGKMCEGTSLRGQCLVKNIKFFFFLIIIILIMMVAFLSESLKV